MNFFPISFGFVCIVTILFVNNLEVRAVRSISDEELDELEGLLTVYSNKLTKDLSETKFKKEEGSYKTSPTSSTTTTTTTTTEASKTEQSLICAQNAKLEEKRCLSGSRTTTERDKCPFNFVAAYSKCFFGTTLTSGSKDPTTCHDSCTYNNDQCVINSGEIDTFVCIAGRDVCKSHCPDCSTDGGNSWTFPKKRSCETKCGETKSSCVKLANGDVDEDTCNYAEMLCSLPCK